uniref:Major facilitator superfamily (MFS) profile domain-containing protein n=1 Tax=Neogobius melanostomus TaxID=47308 RepID=A0A8C6TX70_9GOBI
AFKWRVHNKWNKGTTTPQRGADKTHSKGKLNNQYLGSGQGTVYHAIVVIFLEFFAWGLLTTPMLTVLHETFPQHTFLMNGLIQGVKGLLSFMSAPLIGALSDVWGRRTFLLVTVFFTCAPIPLMRLSPWYCTPTTYPNQDQMYLFQESFSNLHIY